MKDNRIGVRLSPEMYGKIRERAAATGGNNSTAVRELLEEALGRMQGNPFLDRALMAHAANLVTVINHMADEWVCAMQMIENGKDTTGALAEFVAECPSVIMQGGTEYLNIVFGRNASSEGRSILASLRHKANQN